jgi:hypothetical protein
MRRALATLFSVVAALALGAPVSAEIYRYVDAEGREHWTENPAMVPPEQRSSPLKQPAGTLSVHDSEAGAAPAPRSRKGMQPWPQFEAPAAMPKSTEPVETVDGRGESEWRAEAEHYRRSIEDAELALERCEQRDEKRRIVEGLTDLDACAAKESAIESAEADLERFEDLARRRGVPPGWLR